MLPSDLSWGRSADAAHMIDGYELAEQGCSIASRKPELAVDRIGVGRARGVRTDGLQLGGARRPPSVPEPRPPLGWHRVELDTGNEAECVVTLPEHVDRVDAAVPVPPHGVRRKQLEALRCEDGPHLTLNRRPPHALRLS